MKNNKQVLDALLAETKLEPTEWYNGLQDKSIRDEIIEAIDKSILDFIAICSRNSSPELYLAVITTGLSTLNKFKDRLDTEDQEQICTYYERMMDAVDLESSKGLLNKWLYGFDPLAPLCKSENC